MPFLLLGAVMLVWRVGLWGRGLPLFGNLIFFYHPLIYRVTEELAQGCAPLWNPYAFCGIPLLADPQAGTFCPAHLFFRFFPFAAAFKLELAADLCLLAFFAYCLGRRLGLRRSCAALAGFLAASNGFVYYHAGLVAQLDSLTLMPAVLLFWSSGEGLWAGLALALQYLGGHPFFVYTTLAGCLFFPPPRLARVLLPAGVCALALSAVQLLPALKLFGGSVRAGALDAPSLFRYSLAPGELWRMLSHPWWNRSAANFSGDPTITSFYVGWPALAAALWGIRASRPSRAAAAAALCAAALMLGDRSPFYPVLLKALPGLGLFRFPAQWGGLCALSLSLLAGFGAARLKPAARAALTALVFADLWIFLAAPATARVVPEFYSLRPASLSSGHIGPGPRVAHAAHFLAAQEALAPADASPEEAQKRWFEFKNALLPSHGTVFRVREVVSDNLYRPRRADQLLRPVLDAAKAPSPLLRFLGVSALVDGDAAGGILIRRLASPRPRLTWVPRARRLPEPADLDYLRSDRFDPEKEVLLESPRESKPAAGRGGAEVLEESPTRLAARTISDAPGFLVWADTYDPGWTAAVDGRSVEILRADAAYRAVQLPAGTHEIRFLYRPLPFFLGLWTTLAALVLLAAAAVKSRD